MAEGVDTIQEEQSSYVLVWLPWWWKGEPPPSGFPESLPPDFPPIEFDSPPTDLLRVPEHPGAGGFHGIGEAGVRPVAGPRPARANPPPRGRLPRRPGRGHRRRAVAALALILMAAVAAGGVTAIRQANDRHPFAAGTPAPANPTPASSAAANPAPTSVATPVPSEPATGTPAAGAPPTAVPTPTGPAGPAGPGAGTPPRDFPFRAADGDRLAARVFGVTIPHGVSLEVLDAAGDPVAGRSLDAPGGFVDPVDLPGPGDYMVRVAPAEPGEQGRFHVRLLTVPGDQTADILPDSVPVTIANATPGQAMRLSFPGAAGQRISVNESEIGVPGGMTVSMLGPGGGELGSAFVGPPAGFLDTVVLPADGTYTVLLDPAGSGVGPVTVTMHDLPPDPEGAVLPGGALATLPITDPGQNGAVTFPGVAGQQIGVELTDVAVPDGVTVGITAPDGTTVASRFVKAPGGFVEAVALPRTGTYTVGIDPDADHTGSVTVGLVEVPGDPTASLRANGQAVVLETTASGQNIRLRVLGSPGRVTLNLTGMTYARGLLVAEVDRDGTPVGATAFVSPPEGVATLSVDGGTLVVLDPAGADVGRVTVSVTPG